MKTTIGLCIPNPGWEIVLSQEGFDFQKINDWNEIDLENFMLIIPNEACVREYKKQLIKFINDGGTCIADKDTSSLLCDQRYKKQNVKYVIPDKNSMFYSLGLIDFYTQFVIPTDPSLKELDKDCKIYEYSQGQGQVVILPFSVNELILAQTTMRKRFFAQRKELPSEVVSQNNKGKIREIISLIIQKIYGQMDLPVVKKSVFPNAIENTFIFRVDTDFCSGEDAQNLYDLCEKYDIKATWFVDTKDKKLLSDVYKKFADHEIALHCEQHKIYSSYKENYEHLKRALETLQEQDFYVKGFAAPFGSWNDSLGQVIEELRFVYSSEFALDYDDVPLYPFVNDHFSATLQIPIHPVSIGRLRRSHFNDKEMIRYYKNVVDHSFSHNNPAIIYHHPHHKRLNVIEEIFSYIKSKNVWNPTMHEFSLWWKKRSNCEFSSYITDDMIEIDCDETEMTFRIIGESGSTNGIKPNTYKLENVVHTKKDSLHFGEKKSMRRFYWRDVLQNYEQKQAKKKQ